MASAPNVDGMVDIRSYAIFQDVSFNQNDCAHGADVASVRGPFYRRYTHPLPAGPHPHPTNEPTLTVTTSGVRTVHGASATSGVRTVTAGTVKGQIGPGHQPLEQHPTPYFSVEDEGMEPPQVFDTHRSWLCCFCSVAIVFLIFGTLFSYSVLHRQIQLTYALSNLESIVIGAACLTIFVLVGPLATLVIKCLGFRSTAILGMLLVFIGLLLEGFITNVVIFYISRLVLLPIGGGFAHTASHYMSSFFEEQIKYAVLILCASSTLGILVYSWFAATLQTIIGYKGIHIIFAIIVLLLMTATHAFPMKLNKIPTPESTRAREVKSCVEKNVKKDVVHRAGRVATQNNPDATAELKSCLCVCVCEMGTICNRGFFLWAGITMVGTMTFLVPYLLVYLFQSQLQVIRVQDTLFKLICAFCVPTLIGRLFLIFYNDHTFSFNRTVFQIGVAGTGVILLLFSRVTTYGWLVVWMMGIGMCQGFISVSLPRVTLQTVPRQWLKRAWILIIILDALGSFIGPILIVILRNAQFNIQFQLPTLVIGILQIVATLLTFLIPNDEKNYKEAAPPQTEKPQEQVNPKTGSLNDPNSQKSGNGPELDPRSNPGRPAIKPSSTNASLPQTQNQIRAPARRPSTTKQEGSRSSITRPNRQIPSTAHPKNGFIPRK